MSELSRLLARHPDPRDFNAKAYMVGHLQAKHSRIGGYGRVTRAKRLYDCYDFGYGIVTNVGVLAMANDGLWPAPAGAAVNTLALCTWMATGTGTTAAAASDIALQTPDAVAPVNGTVALLSAPNNQAEQVSATLNYGAAEAVTEWALLGGSALTASTGSPFTAGTATSGTATGTPFAASSATIRGMANNVFQNTAAAASWGLCLTNTTSQIAVPAWYLTASGAAGVAPSSGNAYVIRPVMLDHMGFAAINVVSGDSILFTFTLTFPSGG